jgi:hypothetical protein
MDHIQVQVLTSDGRPDQAEDHNGELTLEQQTGM